MAEKRLDIFLGYWQPTMQSVAKPYLDKQQIDVISPATLSDAHVHLCRPRLLPMTQAEDLRRYRQVP